MQKLIQFDKRRTEISELVKKEPKLSEQFKKDLIRVRKGKFTRYKNAQEILDELGL
jgi:hypothetical protein